MNAKHAPPITTYKKNLLVVFSGAYGFCSFERADQEFARIRDHKTSGFFQIIV